MIKNSKKILTIIHDFCSNLINKNNEIKVWQKYDGIGNTYWLVFDPTTGYYSYFNSEQEVRIWLEERYHRHPKQNY
ncbi:MAG: hypothetical protein QNJ53_08810 [Pleurocapsa sp. MO_192.B19]|nr:hypothetical protein [Pleurocapsa sp. MO_192.B19]